MADSYAGPRRNTHGRPQTPRRRSSRQKLEAFYVLCYFSYENNITTDLKAPINKEPKSFVLAGSPRQNGIVT